MVIVVLSGLLLLLLLIYQPVFVPKEITLRNHYKPCPYHGTNLDTIGRHRLAFHYRNIACHNRSSCYFSSLPHNIPHLDIKTSRIRVFYHLKYSPSIFHRISIIAKRTIVLVWLGMSGDV